jgi:coenzyme F420-reducing hydrogenase gamma subunit
VKGKKNGCFQKKNKNNPSFIFVDFMQKKLKVGWFSFSCCEDSTIIFTELLNDNYEKWFKLIDFKSIRVLKSKSEIKDMDVAFVEGAIANMHDVEELKKIRANCKKLVAIGSCAVTGSPAGQRNNFNEELKNEIAPMVEKYLLNKVVKRVDEVVKVDDYVGGCPMIEETFIKVLEKYLKEFGVTNA